MNKSALRNFAVNARNELLERVAIQARKIGITEENIDNASIESSDAVYVNGKQLSDAERKQRNKLINRIHEIGFDQVMEETAYTWFNRFAALRFMEVNDYLPTKVRVLSSEAEGSTEPDMLKEALSLNLDIDKQYVYNLKLNNQQDELFEYLIKLHCNDLNRYMPFMFETLEDYTEILFPEGLLGTDSFVREMTDTETIPEEDWQAVEIIGWLYQYYIVEEKDKVFADLKKNIKVNEITLPAATQLFTPNWIVRYMVENSLGRIWLEGYPHSELKNEWEYYLDEAKQDEETLQELEKIKYENVNPEELTFLDPACGSGHILVYAFDVFYQLYQEKGYIESEIPKLILEKNLYGLDVDDRAAQLASFSVMMRAREKSRRIFKQKPELNITDIQDTSWLTDNIVQDMANQDEESFNVLNSIQEAFSNAKSVGSLISTGNLDIDTLKEVYEKYITQQNDLFTIQNQEKIKYYLPKIFKQIDILSNKYDVVCTNPPYMGRKSFDNTIKQYVDKMYPKSKSDLFSVFIERGFELSKDGGFNTLVTMQSWMFLFSFEELRKRLLETKTITTLVHMDNMVMGIAFGTSATVFRNVFLDNYKGRFTEVKYEDINKNEKPEKFPIKRNRHGIKKNQDFNKIPRSPIAYWVSESIIKNFNHNVVGSELTTREGMATADNNRFLRLWYEVQYQKIKFNSRTKEDAINSGCKWIPYNKGGDLRKWYGNNFYVVNWQNDGYEIKNNIDKKTGRVRSHNYNGDFKFRRGITWSALTSGVISLRYSEPGFLFDSKGAKGFCENTEELIYILGLLNSRVSMSYLKFISPTLDFKVGDIIQIPLIKSNINNITKDINYLVKSNIKISRTDWDSFETSWDFARHPFLKFNAKTIESAFNQWDEFAEDQFNKLKSNEEELNRIFIDIYGLQDELTPDVADEDVTVNKADLERDVKSFISYAVGCMLGRYSLDEDGIVFAGGEFDPSRYQTFPADENNILPILPGNYFEDDILSRFIYFVRVIYGEETLEENLDFIADAIGRRKNEVARETIRRYFLRVFYKNHVQIYKNRPIYWLFTSGKEKAFNCLIYMHRYDKTTLSRIRTDYLHEVQGRYDYRKDELLAIIEEDVSAKEVREAKKELRSVEKKIEELKSYDEKLHHLADQQIEIDLDDGVKDNYGEFKDVVAKI